MSGRIIFRFIAFAIAAYLAAPISADARTIRVPGDQPTIQAGIDAARTGDTVLVAPGTYTGTRNRNLDFGGKRVFLESEAGPRHTIIDCESAGRGFIFRGYGALSPLVTGFTVMAGSAEDGGAILCEGSARPVFRDCRLIGNAAVEFGGAICVRERAALVLENCSILQNRAAHGGGLSIHDAGELRVENSVVARNRASIGGPAAYSDGAARSAWSQCTLAQNWTRERGSIVADGESSARFANSILWDRTCTQITDPHGRVEVAFSNVRGGWDGLGNIEERPIFTSRWGLTHLLESDSPGVDEGDPSGGADGLRWTEGVGGAVARVDMGAYGGDGARGWTPRAPESEQAAFLHGAVGDTIRVPGDYPTIQEALDNAKDGDTILIEEGDYLEYLTITDKSNLKIIGTGAVVNISGSGTLPVVKLDGVENFFMKNLNLSSGRHGIQVIESVGTMTIEDVFASSIGDDGFTVDAIMNLDITLKNVDFGLDGSFDGANGIEVPVLDGGGFLGVSGGQWSGGDNGFSITRFGLTGFLEVEDLSVEDLEGSGIEVKGRVEGFLSFISTDFTDVENVFSGVGLEGTFLYQAGDIRNIRGRFCELDELTVGAEMNLYDLDASSLGNFASITRLQGSLTLKDSTLRAVGTVFEVGRLDVDASLELEHVDLQQITDGLIVSEFKGGVTFNNVRGVDFNTMVDTRNTFVGGKFEMSYSEMTRNRQDWGFKLGGGADFDFERNHWKGKAFIQYNADPFTNGKLNFEYEDFDGEDSYSFFLEVNKQFDEDEGALARNFVSIRNSTFKNTTANVVTVFGQIDLEVSDCQFVDSYNGIYATDVDTLNVTRSQFVRNDFGISLWNGGALLVSECDLVQAEYSAIYWNMYDASSSMDCRYSNFSGSGENGIYIWGFADDQGDALDCRFNAQFNSWGNSTGPSDWSDDWYDCRDYNPGGLGDAISDQVGYRPWDPEEGLRLLLTEQQSSYEPGDRLTFTIHIQNKDLRDSALTRGVFWAHSEPTVDYQNVLYDGAPFAIDPGQPFSYPFSMVIPGRAPLGNYTAGITIYEDETELDTYSFDFQMVPGS